MGKARASEILRTGLRIFGYQVAFGFFGFMFIPALMGASDIIRLAVVGLLVAAGMMLMFMDGSYRGERDCAMGETLDKLEKKGSYKASDAEQAKRFSRMKGVLAALAGAAPIVLLAAYVAITAKPYVYTLQDLPGWLGAYTHRPEVGGALGYLQDATAVATVTDYLRIAVRFVLFPFVGLFGTMTDATSLLFDRISPLLALIMPAITAIGYQFGPRRHAKTQKQIEEAKSKPRKRLKKDAAKRKAAPKEKKQLI